MLPWPVIDDDLGFGVELLELAHQLDAVDVGQHHVGDDRVGPPGLEELFAARADERGPHFVARVLEQDLQPLGHRRLVVDREHAFLTFDAHDTEDVANNAQHVNTHQSMSIVIATYAAFILMSWPLNLAQPQAYGWACCCKYCAARML